MYDYTSIFKNIQFVGDRGLPAILIGGHNALSFIGDNLTLITWLKNVTGYVIIFDTVITVIDGLSSLLSGEAHFFGYHDYGYKEVE